MYKSRTLAGAAIKSGKVKLNGENFKPAHIVQVGETYTMNIGHNKKIIKVTELTARRSSFEIAQKHYTDHSPAPEKEELLPSVFLRSSVKRDKGTGRPTKKDRRDMEGLEGF